MVKPIGVGKGNVTVYQTELRVIGQINVFGILSMLGYHLTNEPFNHNVIKIIAV